MDEGMECEHSEQVTRLMSLRLDGLLDADGKQRLQRHVMACRSCQLEWDAMQQVSSLFEQSPMVGPPLGFAIKVERRLDEKVKKRHRAFGGLAVLTSSLSLAGMTVAAVALIVLGVVAWYLLGSLPAVQQGTSAFSLAASGVGLMGRGASLFLKDLLVRYGPPLVFLLGLGLVLLMGMWTWILVKRPGSSQRNGYV